MSWERIAVESFIVFFFRIFSLAIFRIEGSFLSGKHLKEWAYRVQHHRRTCFVSARAHLKTTIGAAYLAWIIYRMQFIKQRYNEWLFMSYKEDLAGYHLKRLKRYLDAIPEYYPRCTQLTSAETFLHYIAKGGNEFICEPAGIMSFKRGRHPHGIILDDPLKDPESKMMDTGQLDKIKRIFLEEIEQMPKEEMHIFGTPQDRADMFGHIHDKMPDYFYKEYPAIQNYERKEVLWVEGFPYERLMKIRNSIGEKAFVKEFMCRPARQEESFIRPEVLDRICKRRLKNYNLIRPVKFNNFCYGGMDIGKKTHPSHLCILANNRHGKLVQVHSKWMDGWDYKDQIAYCEKVIKHFKVEWLYFDNTRAEFEGFKEQNTLPSAMKGLVMTSKSNWELASKLDALITADKIMLLDEPRQKRQMLNVDNDLKAPANEEGHADCFWSLVMAIRAFQKGNATVVWEV